MYSRPKISKYKEDVKLVEYPSGKKIYLIGTAHVSKVSAELVSEILDEVRPNSIAIELDEKRCRVLKNKNDFENLDIIRVIKNGQGFFFIGHLLLSSFQKKLSDSTSTKPGMEFRRVLDFAQLNPKCNVHLIDRDIGITLKRVWKTTGFWGQIKIINSLLFEKKERYIDEKTLEKLKKENELFSLIQEISDEFPTMKKILIDERDTYLTGNIQKIKDDICVVVVGAGHVPGIVDNLKKPISQEELDKLEIIPKTNIMWRLLPWIIPAAVIALLVMGFVTGKVEETKTALWSWILVNGCFTATGCIIAMAHPLTILTGFIVSPITSLNPTIGSGMVTALVQSICVPPRVIDFVNIQESVSKVKKWWKNRLTKLLMVFVFSSLGSAIGTFVAFSLVMKISS